MQHDYSEMFKQLGELRNEYPGIITNVSKGGKFDYLGFASMTIIEKGFVSIGYNRFGFYVSMSENFFNDKYFPTAEAAFDELSIWMHKYGYRFKKYDAPKVVNLGGSSVSRETISN